MDPKPLAAPQRSLEISASRNFTGWLHEHGLSLACTTYQSARLLLFGLKPDGGLSGFERLFDRAMGLCVADGGERLWLAGRYQLWRLDNVLAPGETRDGYDRLYVPRVGHTTGDLDVHDLAVDRHGRVLMVATGLNGLATLGERHSCTPLWRPPFVSRLAREDRCHLNGLALVEGEARYVTLVGASDSVDGWRDHRRDGGQVWDLRRERGVGEGLSMPHSPRWYRGRLWLLDSGRGELGWLDPASGRFDPICFCPGYARGLAFHEHYAIVGLSKPRDATFSGLELDQRLAAKGTAARCGLLVVDLDSGDFVEWLRLEGVVSELYDVQVLPGARRPKALGFKTDEIARLITFEAPGALWPEDDLGERPAEAPESAEEGSAADQIEVVSAPSPALGEKRIIAFSLWGDNPKYTVGAIKNARLAPEIYPGWICRFYLDESVPEAIRAELAALPHVEIVMLPGRAGYEASLWRFRAAADEHAIVAARDADSRLSRRERAAVEAWLASDRDFHLMRDHPRHHEDVMGGLWGVRNGLLADIEILIGDYLGRLAPSEIAHGVDQRFLAGVVYPRVRDRALEHDEIFGGEPFPTPRESEVDYVGRIFEADDAPIAAVDRLLSGAVREGELEHPDTPVIARLRAETMSRPEDARIHLELGKRLKREGRKDEAAASFREAIRLKPDHVPALNNLGTLLQRQGEIDEAAGCYERALGYKPDVAELHSNLGSIRELRGEWEAAEAGYRRALALKPTYAPAHFNLGRLLVGRGRMMAAMESYRAAVRHRPDYGEAWFALGEVCEMVDRLEEALEAYRRAAALDPTARHIPHYLSYVYMKLCDWSHYPQQLRALLRDTRRFAPHEAVPMRSLSAFPVPPEHHLAVARQIATGVAKEVAGARERCRFEHWSTAEGRLRVGYLSPDLRAHAVGKLVHGLFARHDRSAFEITAYSLLPVEDDFSRCIRAGCDRFVPIHAMTAEAAARRIHADGIDILIDLGGYNLYTRPGILALRPAPVQAQFLGYADTMGADFVDYLLADHRLVDDALARYCSESIVYLPHAFMAPTMTISEAPMTRESQGLPEDAFVLCCFNAYYKIDPPVFDAWMRILGQVTNGILWLKQGSERARANLCREAERRGVDPGRIRFAGNLPEPEYLARYRLADLFLDTFTYSAGSTGACALYAGLPLLTRPGETNASRMGASLCAAAGLEELICRDTDAYVAKAVALAGEPERLRRMSEVLLRHEAPLFDLAGCAASLEGAFRAMWENYRAGHGPRSIDLAPGIGPDRSWDASRECAGAAAAGGAQG